MVHHPREKAPISPQLGRRGVEPFADWMGMNIFADTATKKQIMEAIRGFCINTHDPAFYITDYKQRVLWFAKAPLAYRKICAKSHQPIKKPNKNQLDNPFM